MFVEGGRRATGREPHAWAAEAERLGAGEILLNSIDRDGSAEGYDLELIRGVTRAVGIPVVACGGVGKYEAFPAAVRDGGASAAARINAAGMVFETCIALSCGRPEARICRHNTARVWSRAARRIG